MAENITEDIQDIIEQIFSAGQRCTLGEETVQALK